MEGVQVEVGLKNTLNKELSINKEQVGTSVDAELDRV